MGRANNWLACFYFPQTIAWAGYKNLSKCHQTHTSARQLIHLAVSTCRKTFNFIFSSIRFPVVALRKQTIAPQCQPLLNCYYCFVVVARDDSTTQNEPPIFRFCLFSACLLPIIKWAHMKKTLLGKTVRSGMWISVRCFRSIGRK